MIAQRTARRQRMALKLIAEKDKLKPCPWCSSQYVFCGGNDPDEHYSTCPVAIAERALARPQRGY